MSTIEKAPKKSRIPLIIFAFFGVLIAVNIVFVTTAFKTFSGLADEDPYERGIAYNDTLHKAEAQEQLGWQVDLRRERFDGMAHLVIDLKDADGNALEGAVITAKLYRPVVQGMDQAVQFMAVDGSYRASLEGAHGGNWELRVLIERGEDSYRFSRRLVL